MKSSVVPEDWKASCIFPVYKGKGGRGECASYRGISILSIHGKIYGSVLISRVTGGLIDDEQGGFRAGRGV